MISSARALMEQLLDYAGLFPPAALPLEQAIRNYAAYRDGRDAWMLGRFIIPSAQLEKLSPYMPMFSGDWPLRLSVLGTRSRDAEECLQLLDDTLRQTEAFRGKHGSSVNIDVLELPLPPSGADRRLLDEIAAGASEHGLRLFFEWTFPLNGDWGNRIEEALDAVKCCASQGGMQPGVKLRTGGVTSDAFPSPEQVAAVLVGCRDRQLALKFTAGLHHPVRMYREEVKTEMHGFLNVFVAGMLAHVYKLDRDKTAEILADKDPDSLVFLPDALGWRTLTISAGEVRRLRNQALCSYGSCSFDEPRDELRELKSIE
ncbi:hypothetical protein AV654_15530 [Paenibacillus elgii]|uniref:Uncharacterized protein n=1 Tax=Paenibacillus elgii TaxID=189691 RepID=A0A163Y4W1_9BACL|nr:hypothetical protein [Paenibacillus elgii]KZE78901.1 hypothetical protein AV654_15530 [Paenibacillus elgii]